jgi:putative redox protein
MPTTVTVESAPANFLETITAGRHTLQADEPVSAGGADVAPTPYELLLGALGACKTITLRMYANRKQWPLEGVRIKLSHDRVHAEDCAKAGSASCLLDHIEVEIELVGNLTAEQRRTLVEIAEKCPVQRTLSSQIVIRTRAKQ